VLADGAGGDGRRHRSVLSDARAFAEPPCRTGGERRTSRGSRRWSRILQGDPLRGPTRWRPAVATTPASGAVDWRAPSRGLRGGLHAKTIRAAPGSRRAPGAGPVRRLPLPKRLASCRRHAHGGNPCHGLDSRRCVRVRQRCLPDDVGGQVRQARRRPRHLQLPPRPLRLLRLPRVEP